MISDDTERRSQKLKQDWTETIREMIREKGQAHGTIVLMRAGKVAKLEAIDS